MTGISLPQLHRLEVGACYPRADKLPTLAKALGCRIDDLFTEEELDAKAPADDTPPWEEDDDSLDGLLE